MSRVALDLPPDLEAKLLKIQKLIGAHTPAIAAQFLLANALADAERHINIKGKVVPIKRQP